MVELGMKNVNLSDEQLAYIAGFLDGDGSIFAQIIKGSGYRYGYYIRVTLAFYQKNEKYWFMLWLKGLLRYGSIRKKPDGMCEYTIVSSSAISILLSEFLPYLKLKKALARHMLQIIAEKRKIKSKDDFRNVCRLVDETAQLTYSKSRRIYSTDLFPVETFDGDIKDS